MPRKSYDTEKMKNNSSLGAKLIFSLSMVIWGTLGAFTRYIGVSSGELALYRALFAVLLIGGYMLLFRKRLDIRAIKKELLLLLVSGMALGINWVLLFQAYKYTSVSLATLSYYFAPVLVTVLSPFLFRERLTVRQISCFVMSTVGLALIVGVGGGGGKDGIGILYGLGAALLYATVMLMNKYIKAVEGLSRTLMQFLGAVTVLLPYALLTEGVNITALDLRGWICLLVVCVVHTGVSYCMYFSSLGKLRGQSAAILSYIDPLVAVLVSVFVLDEGMNIWQLVGGGLILGFTLYNELGGISARKNKNEKSA